MKRTPSLDGLALLLCLFAILGLPAHVAAGTEASGAAFEVEFHSPPGPSSMPFSESVRVGNLLFLAGQIGAVLTEGARGLPPGGIGPETRQTMENIRAALERQGLTMNDVVKCTVMLADIAEWAAMNEVYRTFFTDHFPARSAFGASGLALGARVEIECIAAFQ
ncbi:MAG: RidA family protein [Thermoanaerobaculia bacterium]